MEICRRDRAKNELAMKRIALLAILPAFLVGCAAGNKSSYSVTPDVSVTVKDTRKKAKSPYVQQDAPAAPVAGAAGGASR
jgi:PBP1b-binding outer membrane lipoprotein LpoB